MFFKNKPNKQVERIKVKLMKVKEKDSNCNVFGSEKFRYNLNPVISVKKLEDAEKRLEVRLPEAFRIFLTQLGNGGTGPYYGVCNLDAILKNNETRNNCAKNSCCLYPNMSKGYWDELVKPLENGDIFDEEYDLFEAKLYGGLLYFGTQGCTCDMYLVVTGEYAGRIVYTDDPYEDCIFFFAYEENFLDWYERWLDEILLEYNTSWFGYVMSGNEYYLLDLFNNSQDQQEKINVLEGFYKFKHISDSSYKELEKIALENFKTNESITRLVTENLTRIDFNRAKNLLHKLLNSDNETYIELAADTVSRQKNCDINEFSDEILNFLNSDNETHINCAIDILRRHLDSDLFQFKDGILNAFYSKKDEKLSSDLARLICKVNLNSYDIFGEWLKSSSPTLIANALGSLSNIPYDKSYFETIKNLLLINDREISQRLLNGLGVIEDERLLIYYKNLWNTNIGHNSETHIKCIESFKITLENLKYPLDFFERDDLLVELLEQFNISLQNENVMKIVNVSCIKDLERVFIIYFLKDKSKCVATYDCNGNFIFETKVEDTKVPMYFTYDFKDIYVLAFDSAGNINETKHSPEHYIATLDLDSGELIGSRRTCTGWFISERERSLMKLTL